MATTAPRPAFVSAIIYKDNRAALNWLQKAFGFEVSEVLTDANDNIVHAEMKHGDGVVMIGHEWADWTKSPASLGGKNTQRVFVRIDSGIDEHCVQARGGPARPSRKSLPMNSMANAATSPSISTATIGRSRKPSNRCPRMR